MSMIKALRLLAKVCKPSSCEDIGKEWIPLRDGDLPARQFVDICHQDVFLYEMGQIFI